MVDFVDKVRIFLHAGSGGNGCASIRREKFRPLAGPNGGSGGRGGSIYIRADSSVSSLLDYHFSPRKHAENGEMGYGGSKDGKHGNDLHLKVPVGTVIRTVRGELIEDLAEDGQVFLAVVGGSGGLGNESIANKHRKAPGFSLSGIPGEEADLILELKLLADVALVGFPSSGKSSVIASISAARPKIADYPFTTLTPNLGVVSSYGYRFVVADVPGLIPGASNGKGLGLEFLRHIERTLVIVHVIDTLAYESGRDPISDLEAIEKELDEYTKLHMPDDKNPLLNRAKLVILNKVDDSAGKDLANLAQEELKSRGYETFQVSALTHDGLKEFVLRLGQVVKELKDNLEVVKKQEVDNIERQVIELKPKSRANTTGFEISKHEDFDGVYFEVVGEKPRIWVLQTDFGNDEAVGYLSDRLQKLGIEDELAKQCANEGDEVRISLINPRAQYLKNTDEYYVFDYKPSISSGAEVLYANKRGEDTRLEFEERVHRPTRQKKREEYHARQDARSSTRHQFEMEREIGFWADPAKVDDEYAEEMEN
ncbi:MAG: GTPase ObgE [Candidatus Ancillula sp.]|nr:GTPase ObgE [Candidatus Ancillula sp.]